jgi:hypothetical protein
LRKLRHDRKQQSIARNARLTPLPLGKLYNIPAVDRESVSLYVVSAISDYVQKHH